MWARSAGGTGPDEPVPPSKRRSLPVLRERLIWTGPLTQEVVELSLSFPSRARRRAAVALVTAAAALTLAGCGGTPTDDAASSIVRTTTEIAGAGVVGIDRDTATACPTPTPVDPELTPGSTRRVLHVAGETVVPADPQRIVVLDSTTMDAVCALGLWERVVGAATGESSPQPAYLGTGIAERPSIGPVGHPDVGRVAHAAPDLILGSAADTDLYGRLSAIAPTVIIGSDPVFWKDQFLRAGEALGRNAAAAHALEAYRQDAARIGIAINSSQTQASVVQFMPDATRIQGPASFPGQVLADAGVRRPRDQDIPITDGKPYIEIGDDGLERAEGDLIYVIFAGTDGEAHGTDVMRTEQWEDLGAVRDKRVFAVDDDIWSGNGVVAARAILTDLQNSLNGYAG